MQAKKLKQLLNTDYTVEYAKDSLCISSAYVTGLIKVNKNTLELSYALDTFHEGRKSLRNEKLEKIWDKLDSMIKDGSIKEIINNNDSIDGMKKFYYFDWQKKTVIESYTDKYGWPNVDYTGKMIYDNNCFKSKKAAVKYAIKQLLDDIECFNKNIQESLKNINKFTEDIHLTEEALKNLYN